MSNNPVLRVEDLKTYFYLEDDRVAKAVDDVSLEIYPGETVAIVGESGSGKSMTGLSIMRLVRDPGKIVNGSIHLEETDILALSDRQITSIRGNDISMIFQEPMTALNPVFTIGNQMIEMLKKHKKMNTKDALAKAIELLKLVGIPRPNEIVKEYPHQLSGGMRQRIMIAILYKHTLRNALIPIITLMGFEFGTLLGGAIITEQVFNFPGLGTLFISSVVNRDYPVVMAIALFLGLAILIGNLLADIFYSIVDPRIRYD